MTTVLLPQIDMARCTGCGTCARECPDGIVTMVEDRPSFNDVQTCSYCGLCEDICPVNAITLTYRIIGPQGEGYLRN